MHVVAMRMMMMLMTVVMPMIVIMTMVVMVVTMLMVMMMVTFFDPGFPFTASADCTHQTTSRSFILISSPAVTVSL
tara:strand:+ start:480 stop:707 length:228 start_codon:yes stop_codon:yes gene_type:complete